MTTRMKVWLGLLAIGLLLCGAAIFYAKNFAMTGSQPVFISLYLTGTLLTASGGAGMTYLTISRFLPRFKIPGALAAVVIFAVVAVGLFSPFYMLKAE